VTQTASYWGDSESVVGEESYKNIVRSH
jgi:hypothetical protein